MKKLLLLLVSVIISVNSANAGECYVGGDISLLPSYEASGNVYLDARGNKIDDLITWLKEECGWNSFRVRLFVNPQKLANDGKTFDPAVCQNLEYVEKLGKRIKDAGCSFMLDIHYSDTYVDAGHIQSPADWKSLSNAEKAEKMYSYTKETLESLKNYGAQPDLVQVGNEIMYGFCDIKVAPYDKSDSNWPDYLALLKNGCNAVREVCPQAKIIIHTDRPANQEYNKYYYQKLVDGGVDFDIIGLSFYPFWHGWITSHPSQYNSGLKNALYQLATDFPSKKVQIVETAYNFQYWPSSGINYDTRDTWTCDADGQYKFVKDLLEELENHSNVNGVFYWCPEEAGCGDGANWDTMDKVVITSWINRGLWWSENSNGHWPLSSGGTETTKLFKDYATAGIQAVNSEELTVKSRDMYNILGQKTNKVQGIIIKGGKKVLQP